MDTWATVDGNFNYSTFFWLIVSLFDDGKGADIIKLFNKYVYILSHCVFLTPIY